MQLFSIALLLATTSFGETIEGPTVYYDNKPVMGVLAFAQYSLEGEGDTQILGVANSIAI